MPDETKEIWTKVEQYFGDLLAPSDEALDAALNANLHSGLPAIDVPRLLGKFLALIVKISGARRILEIGALGGYSTIWLARAVPEDGCVVSLELSPRHVDVATSNLHHAAVLNRVDLRVELSRISRLVVEAIAARHGHYCRQRGARWKGDRARHRRCERARRSALHRTVGRGTAPLCHRAANRRQQRVRRHCIGGGFAGMSPIGGTFLDSHPGWRDAAMVRMGN